MWIECPCCGYQFQYVFGFWAELLGCIGTATVLFGIVALIIKAVRFLKE